MAAVNSILIGVLSALVMYYVAERYFGTDVCVDGDCVLSVKIEQNAKCAVKVKGREDLDFWLGEDLCRSMIETCKELKTRSASLKKGDSGRLYIGGK